MQMNVRDTPGFIEAAKVTLNTRGDLATGWGTAWRICLWARMGEAERAYSILKGLLGPQRTYPNMFDAHPPFQIDGNFGGAAGILEMVLQSWGGEIHLLPALPVAWSKGRVRGIRARGGVVADISWDDGKLPAARFWGRRVSKLSLRYRGELHPLELGGDGRGQLPLGALWRGRNAPWRVREAVVHFASGSMHPTAIGPCRLRPAPAGGGRRGSVD
jgi:alpha-L-fucosidase 2